MVHELYRNPEIHAAVVDRWGDEVAPGGVVDRPAVARRAFADDDERDWLEGLLWPKVGERIAEWRAVESAREPAPPALVVEVPLLFEAGSDVGLRRDDRRHRRRRRPGGAGRRPRARGGRRAHRPPAPAARKGASERRTSCTTPARCEELEQELSSVLAKLTS